MQEHVAFKAAEDSARLSKPQKPEDYALELPKDFKAPAGFEFKLDPNGPLVGPAKAFALKHGLSKDAFHDLTALYAGNEITRLQHLDEVAKAEVAKLGAAGTARVGAIQTWLKATVGEDSAKAVNAMMVTAAHVEAFEKMMKIVQSQGTHGFSQQHREHAPQGRISQQEYDAMSFSERMAYAEKHPQPALNGAGR